VGADAFGLAEGNNRAPRGGETVTMMWTEAPARRCGVEAKAAGNSYSPTSTAILNGQALRPTGVFEQGMSAKVPQEPGRPGRLRRE
jgi:hypothetical protein